VKAARNPIAKAVKVTEIMTQHGPTKLQMTDSKTESQQLQKGKNKRN